MALGVIIFLPNYYFIIFRHLVRENRMLYFKQQKQYEMDRKEYNEIKYLIPILKSLLLVYGGRTLENIIQGLEARIENYKQTRKKTNHQH